MYVPEPIPGYDAWKLMEPEYLRHERPEIDEECEDETDDEYFDRMERKERTDGTG